MPTVKHYGVNRLTLDFAGIPIDSGFAEDSVIKITEDEARWGEKVGADGEVVRYKITNRMATIEISLLQSSDVNAKLSAIRAADDAAPNGAGVGVFTCKDEDGTSKYLISQCWISKPPDVEFGQEVKERTWTFRGPMDIREDGSN